MKKILTEKKQSKCIIPHTHNHYSYPDKSDIAVIPAEYLVIITALLCHYLRTPLAHACTVTVAPDREDEFSVLVFRFKCSAAQTEGFADILTGKFLSADAYPQDGA